MKVAVGSQNPSKIESAKRAFEKVFGSCEVIGVSVSSGVSAMPMSFKEIAKGAKNRAEEAIKRLDTDFGVGLEGGLEEKELGTFLMGIVAVVDKKGVWSYGERGGFLLPERIVKEVRKGRELGSVMDEIMGMNNTKHGVGAIGFFTNGIISRAKSFEAATIHALTRFIRPEMYD